MSVFVLNGCRLVIVGDLMIAYGFKPFSSVFPSLLTDRSTSTIWTITILSRNSSLSYFEFNGFWQYSNWSDWTFVFSVPERKKLHTNFPDSLLVKLFNSKLYNFQIICWILILIHYWYFYFRPLCFKHLFLILPLIRFWNLHPERIFSVIIENNLNQILVIS